jgi:LPXTG-motif cell wall-anchored protein
VSPALEEQPSRAVAVVEAPPGELPATGASDALWWAAIIGAILIFFGVAIVGRRRL